MYIYLYNIYIYIYIYGCFYFVSLSKPVRGTHHGNFSISWLEIGLIHPCCWLGGPQNIQERIFCWKKTPAAGSVTSKELVFSGVCSLLTSQIQGALFCREKNACGRIGDLNTCWKFMYSHIPNSKQFPWCSTKPKSLYGYKIETAIYIYIYIYNYI